MSALWEADIFHCLLIPSGMFKQFLNKKIAFVLVYQYLIPEYGCHTTVLSQKDLKSDDKLKTGKKMVVATKAPYFCVIF